MQQTNTMTGGFEITKAAASDDVKTLQMKNAKLKEKLKKANEKIMELLK